MVKRGDVLVNLEPVRGSEIRKTRPCLVISPSEMHDRLHTVTIAPMTTASRPAGYRIGVHFQGKDGLIVLDQISKFWIDGTFQYGEGIALTSFFNLVHARNTGAAFSFLANEGGWQRFFFIGIATAASILIVYLLRKHAEERGFCLALSLVLGGALGNLIDRVRFGYVVDFLDFYYAGWHFPAFNVADSAISIGAALLIWDSLRSQKKSAA